MATKADTLTHTVLRKLSSFLLLFYITYYTASIVLVGSFQVGWRELGGFPFRQSLADFDPSAGGAALGAWLAMTVTFTCTLGIAYWVVAATRRSWDYLTTTSLLHWGITCAVNVAFPTNWVWWVTLVAGTALASLGAELLIYQLQDMKEIQLAH